MAKEAKQTNKQPYYKDKIELNQVINYNVDLEQIIDEDKLTTKKQVQICKENDALMVFFKTLDYVAGVDKASVDNMDIDQSTKTSAQDYQRPSAPK